MFGMSKQVRGAIMGCFGVKWVVPACFAKSLFRLVAGADCGCSGTVTFGSWSLN